MNAEVVNLRRARKAKARAQRADAGAENRARFGRPKADRDLDAARDARTAHEAEGKKLDR